MTLKKSSREIYFPTTVPILLFYVVIKMMNQQFPLWKVEIQWENGWGGSGGYEQIFGGRMFRIREKSKKIRSYPPDPPHPFFHRIPKVPNAKYNSC
jgi:hypothetical protein